ncbi:hypothetical protein UPYG_G00162390 [Umbra pygmaea]|uniref:Uncharacterized protein n=1 Tax=Umbra pygmaea TaxID=75934 RepID=A0ABD0XCA4_UMBPY
MKKRVRRKKIYRGKREEQLEGQQVDPCGSSSAPSDISKSKNDVAVQAKLNIFPTTLMGDRRLSFRTNWHAAVVLPGGLSPECGEERGPCVQAAASEHWKPSYRFDIKMCM